MSKTILILAVFLLAFCGPAMSDYEGDIINGNEALKAGNYAVALEYYGRAYGLNRENKELASLILLLEKITSGVVGSEPASTMQKTSITTPAPSANIHSNVDVYPASVFVVAADLALLLSTTITYFDYNNSLDKYNGLLASTDDTTYETYLKLLTESDKVRVKENTMTISAVLAVAAYIYTIADVFFLHAAFPVNVSGGVNKDAAGIRLTMNKEF